MIKLATDLDGTIYKGTKLVEGVKDSYENLIDNNVEIYFITNNSSQTPYEIKEKLEKFHVAAYYKIMLQMCSKYATEQVSV